MPSWAPVDSAALVELFGLGRADESKGVAVRFERRAHEVKVARAHFPLMFDGGVAAVRGCKLGLLQVDVRGHPITCIAIGKIEHRQVECVKAR